MNEIFFGNLSTKRNIKKLENWRKTLGISIRGEDYVLQWILNRDVSRQIILRRIDKIRLENNLISVECSTASGTYSFSVSNIDSKGWVPGMTEDQKISNIWQDLNHKIRG